MRRVSQIGATIKRAMAKAGMSQSELAAESGVSRSWIASVNSGKTDKPGPDKLARVAKALGLELRPLLAMTDQLGAVQVTEAPASSDVAAAIDRQTEILSELVNELRSMREVAPAWVEPLLVSLAAARQGSGIAASTERDTSVLPRPGRG